MMKKRKKNFKNFLNFFEKKVNFLHFFALFFALFCTFLHFFAFFFCTFATFCKKVQLFFSFCIKVAHFCIKNFIFITNYSISELMILILRKNFFFYKKFNNLYFSLFKYIYQLIYNFFNKNIIFLLIFKKQNLK